jgi:hypothetical protein
MVLFAAAWQPQTVSGVSGALQKVRKFPGVGVSTRERILSQNFKQSFEPGWVTLGILLSPPRDPGLGFYWTDL